ncbi:putative membrane protein, partial [Vibrio cholerae CP1030(3)]
MTRSALLISSSLK